MKQEIYFDVVYRSFEELNRAVNEYISYYNNEIIKKLAGMSPVEHRHYISQSAA